MARPTVVITTYARPEGLALLLDDIDREAPAGGVDVRVYDDGTPHPDPALVARVRDRGWTYRLAAVNHGKRGWWRWWNTILADLHPSSAATVFVVQDDMRLCRRFFDRALALWEGIDDAHKGSLYLCRLAGRAELGSTCWTGVPARRAGAVVECGWVDCNAFVCGRRLFDALNWRLDEVAESRWARRSELSSGVGQQISVRAHARGVRMYRVDQSLAVHDASPSLMNAEARRGWAMETVAYADGDDEARRRAAVAPRVFASVASVPRRERALLRVVDALRPQVDQVRVYLNGYDTVPRRLERDGVVVARSQDEGDRGDAGKVFWAGSTTGFHLLCDDDIEYPEDYAIRIVEGIERYRRRAAVAFHGSVLNDKVLGYHRSRRVLHLSRGLRDDVAVHVLGTGVAGWHTSALRVTANDFPVPNMADVWFALLGQRRQVPFVCLSREAGWLREMPGLGGESLYARARHRSTRRAGERDPETRAVHDHGRWVLYGAALAKEPPPSTGVATRVARPVAHPAPARTRAAPLVRVRVAGPATGATLALPRGDHITRAVQRSGTYYERDLLDAIREREPRGTFVDIGAHYGNHTAFFALECDAERVVAFEPNAAAHVGLLETVAENRLGARVDVRRVAAHPLWRSVVISARPWRARPAPDASSNTGHVTIGPSQGASDAPAAPLDELLAGAEGVAVVKVDVNGHSADVLFSGRRILRRDRPLVAAEAATDAERSALRSALVPLGYREAGAYCWTPTWLWEAC